MAHRILLAIVLGLLTAIAVTADAPPTDAEVARLIEQLGDRSYQQRQAAQQRLKDGGLNALALLRKAARETGNAELRWRAKVAIRLIARPRWTTMKRGLPRARKSGKLLLVFSTIGEVSGYS